ncbi:MAG: 50S ribosomal protein L30 [Candidatus Bathyarchaeota archaeon]|nr:50S ribosomal protein L30 [Candidatus Termiticorpusculum sp.]MCL1970958.1 50S ribosomal protein L30 [Candidatus Termiticorpusculum sp.]
MTQTEQINQIAVVRIRGTVSAQREARDTLSLLRLDHTNHAILIDDRPAYKGMLQKVNSYVTWGEVTKETIMAMLEKRARLAGNKKVTTEYLEQHGFKTFEALAEAIMTGKAEHGKLPFMTPLFKLHPPSKGFKGNVKKSFKVGGEAGYRGEAINDLVKRMI